MRSAAQAAADVDSRRAGKSHLVKPGQCEGAISFKESLELPLTLAGGTAQHFQNVHDV